MRSETSKALWEENTYKRTRHLKYLHCGCDQATEEEILEIWRTYKEGVESAGTIAALSEFGAWLAGTLDDEVEPLEVVW